MPKALQIAANVGIEGIVFLRWILAIVEMESQDCIDSL